MPMVKPVTQTCIQGKHGKKKMKNTLIVASRVILLFSIMTSTYYFPE